MVAKKIFAILAIGIILTVFGATRRANGQEKEDYSKILGNWDMEVDAGGEYFYLSFTIEKTGEGLKGSISESSGFFSDVTLENIRFDGTALTFEMEIPTPPDGYENMVKADLELIEGKLKGTLTVESLGISAAATAAKKS